MAWVRYPRSSNTSDASPWENDRGVRVSWVNRAEQLQDAKAIVLPGSKNTMDDLRWLKQSGLAAAIRESSAPILGICGGYQMLGDEVIDEAGEAGGRGRETGLGLLPVSTRYQADKIVRQATVDWGSENWSGYEIHMGRTETGDLEPLTTVNQQPEGAKSGRVWGTYLHGLFDGASARADFAALAGIEHSPSEVSYAEQKRQLYGLSLIHI